MARTSDLFTLIVTPIIRHRNFDIDCDSTEDMLHAIEQANLLLDKDPKLQNDLTIFSMDAEALFPSLALKDIKDGIWTLIVE